MPLNSDTEIDEELKATESQSLSRPCPAEIFLSSNAEYQHTFQSHFYAYVVLRIAA